MREKSALGAKPILRVPSDQGRLNSTLTRPSASRCELGPNTKVNEWLGKYLAVLDDESRELKDRVFAIFGLCTIQSGVAMPVRSTNF